MKNSFDLSGNVALVTGSSTGLGQGIALGLAQAGAKVIGLGPSDSSATAEKIKAIGGEFTHLKADLTATNDLTQLIDQAREIYGDINILVNNAGTIRRQDAIEFTEDNWDAVMDLNLKKVFFLSQSVARHWVDAGTGGKIINIASLLSFQGGIRIASYTASKSGLAGLTKLLACEWADKGICVNAIAPGYFSTNNTTALRADEERNNAILARIPAGHWGQPDDLSGAAVFLASSASDYIHGIVLPVDGGWLAR